MYHSTIPIHLLRSSLRTDRQTNKRIYKQKDMLILLIYKTRASPVDGHSCSPSPIPVSFPVRNPRLYSPSPSLLLFLFTENYSPTLSIDSNMSHLNQPSNSIICQHIFANIWRVILCIYMFTNNIYLSSQCLLHQKNVSLKKIAWLIQKVINYFYKERIIKKITAFCTSEKIKIFRRPKITFFGIFSYQVIISSSKIDNFGARKSAHPAMYHSTILTHFPSSSLRTNKQTNRLTNRKTCLFY